MMKERAQKEAREEREGNQHGTGAATSSQTADARAHGSRSVLAGSGNDCWGPDESSHRLPLEARSSHPRRSGPARWPTGTPRQSASRRAALAGVAVSGDLAGPQQPIAKRTARAVGSADQHQSPQRRSSSAWMEQRSQPGGKKTVRAEVPTEQQWPSALRGKRARTGACDGSESA